MKNTIFLSFFSFTFILFSPLLSVFSFVQTESVALPSPVLILVDIQNFYFPGGKLPLQGAESASLKAKKILDLFRQKQWPVVHVRHLSKNIPESAATPESPQGFHVNVLPAAGEAIVSKRQINSFRETNLLDILQGFKAKELVIVGMQTQMCLEAAVRAAADLGFSVTVAEDACATRDLEFNGKKIPADQVHLSTLATLQGSYARVLTTDTLIAELSPTPQK